MNVSTLSDDIFGYFKYECQNDIRLHLFTRGNSVKSIRMTLIFGGSTSPASLNVILTLGRVHTSSLSYTAVGNVFLLAPFASLIAPAQATDDCILPMIETKQVQ